MDMKKFKKYAIPALTVFVVITIVNTVFHGVIMEKTYLQNAHLFRPMDAICQHKYYFWLANLIFSFAFCYIYSKGHEKTDPVAQGIRFGLWISLLIWVPAAITNYTIYPHPQSLELAWLLGHTVESVLAGITAAHMFSRTK